jgi:lysophospholipase L1-like esterase
MTWANALLGQPFQIVTNVSLGGSTSAQIRARVDDVLETSPEYVIGHDWWQNDVLTSVSAVTTQANIEAIIDDCNAAGATVILTDYLPMGAYTTDAMIEQDFEMRDWLYARQDKGFTFVPITDLIVDPTTGLPLSWATYDGSHPSPRGARAMGEILADRIGHLFRGRPARQPVAASVYAGGGVKGNPKELVKNPMMTGSSSGVALFYGLTGTGTPTGTKIVATDYPNLEWQRITFGTDGTAVLAIDVQTAAGLTFGDLTLVPGTTRTRFGFEFRMPAASMPGKWATVTGYQYYAPASETYYALQDTSAVGQDQGFLPDDNLIYQAQSTDALMPVGSTAIDCGIVLYGQAGAVIDLRRTSLTVVN